MGLVTIRLKLAIWPVGIVLLGRYWCLFLAFRGS